MLESQSDIHKNEYSCIFDRHFIRTSSVKTSFPKRTVNSVPGTTQKTGGASASSACSFEIRDFDYFIRPVTRKVIATVKIPYNSGKAARIKVLVPTS